MAIDLSKRYDLYCTFIPGERVYEDVKILGIRTFERIGNRFSSGLIGGYIEIEARDGTRGMISYHGVRMMAEHGSALKYRIVEKSTEITDPEQ